MSNVGTLDRLLRVLLGVAILLFVPRTAWAWFGVIPLLTGAFGYCPLYQLFGWSTVRKVRTT